MREIYLGTDPDARTVRSWTQWLEYVLAFLSFVAALWFMAQFSKLLIATKTGEPVYLYRSQWAIVAIRFTEMIAHLVFFREVVKKGFPNLVPLNHSNRRLYIALVFIIVLPWAEQLWASFAFPSLVLFAKEFRHPFLILITMAYGLLPIWQVRIRKFPNYHTGGKIAASLLLLVILTSVVEFLP